MRSQPPTRMGQRCYTPRRGTDTGRWSGCSWSEGADVSVADKHGRTPLHGAGRRGREAVVRLIMDGGADIPAAEHGSAATCRARERDRGGGPATRGRGADISAAEKGGQTPLCDATRNRHEAAVRCSVM